MTEETRTLIMTICETVVVPLMGIAAFLITGYIRKWSTKATENGKLDSIGKYIAILVDLVISCVESTNQIYVDELKKTDKDLDNGNEYIVFDKDAQRKAFEMTKAAVLKNLNGSVKEAITEFVGDFDAYLDVLIESSVAKCKGDGE